MDHEENDEGLTRNIRVTRIAGDEWQSEDDRVVREDLVTLRVNGTPLLAFACLPADLEALAAGFLFSEAIARRPAELAFRVEDGEVRAEGPVDEERLAAFGRGRILTTGTSGSRSALDPEAEEARPPALEEMRVAPAVLLDVMEKLAERARIFRATGGTHVACLADARGRVLFAAEDVGRHNAVDKVVGRALLENEDTAGLLLALSGRVSSEILLKAVRARLPLIVSRSAPTHRTLAMAENLGLTVVGFARGRRMNLYTRPERIVAPVEGGDEAPPSDAPLPETA